jgi:hypothetical protein
MGIFQNAKYIMQSCRSQRTHECVWGKVLSLSLHHRRDYSLSLTPTQTLLPPYLPIPTYLYRHTRAHTRCSLRSKNVLSRPIGANYLFTIGRNQINWVFRKESKWLNQEKISNRKQKNQTPADGQIVILKPCH